jgi:hypothetical protein
MWYVACACTMVMPGDGGADIIIRAAHHARYTLNAQTANKGGLGFELELELEFQGTTHTHTHIGA